MDKKKLFMIVSIAILAIAVIGGASTYAWYMWSTDENSETKIVTNIGTARVFYNGGANIENAVLKPTNNRLEDGIVKDITVKTDKETTYKISFNLYLDVISLDEGLKDVSFRYALYKEGTTDAVKEGNFSQSYLDNNLVNCEINSTSHIVLVSDETVTTTTQKYTLYIWIDGENYVNPSEMQGKTFSFKLHADGENAVLGETIVEHINNLYNNASKTVVTNNEINYNYATSVSLMNDRLGGTTDSYDAGNIRYYGGNPNNYIDIGDVYTEDTIINNMEKNSLASGAQDEESCHAFYDCDTNYETLGSMFGFEFTDSASCKKILDYESTDDICATVTKKAGDPVLYRIIGLFKNVKLTDGTTSDLIKVIREDSIGDFAWDLTSADEQTATYDNNWHNATLNNVLNNGYLKSSSGITHYYVDMLTGSPATATTDFTKIGISPIQNKVAEVVWNLGGYESTDVYANELYNYERGDTKCSECTYETIWEGKVALAYPSDHAYGTDLSLCSLHVSDFNYLGCNSVNWISSLSNGTAYEYLLTPGILDNNFVSYIFLGIIDLDPGDSGIGARPTFYLDASLGIISGDGSEGNPYVVR